MTFAEFQLQEFGYECMTTFWDDFSIADHFGDLAVKDTFRRSMRDFGKDYKYLTELVIVLNHKCWQHYNQGHESLSRLYHDLYFEAKDYADEHLQGEEYEYYYSITD